VLREGNFYQNDRTYFDRQGLKNYITLYVNLKFN